MLISVTLNGVIGKSYLAPIGVTLDGVTQAQEAEKWERRPLGPLRSFDAVQQNATSAGSRREAFGKFRRYVQDRAVKKCGLRGPRNVLIRAWSRRGDRRLTVFDSMIPQNNCRVLSARRK